MLLYLAFRACSSCCLYIFTLLVLCMLASYIILFVEHVLAAERIYASYAVHVDMSVKYTQRECGMEYAKGTQNMCIEVWNVVAEDGNA